MSGFRRTALGEALFALPTTIRWLLVTNLSIWLALLLIFSAGWQAGGSFLMQWLGLNEPIPWLWQFLSYAFLHDPFDIIHVAFNMFALWMFGRELEARWGSASFLRFYLVCAFGAAVCHELVGLVFPALAGIVVGASGAVLGLFAAYGILFPERTVLAFFMIPVKAKYMVLGMAALELIIAWNPNSGVANFAHLGGMLTAWIYLKHAWRVTELHPVAWLGSRIRRLRRSRRRARFEVLDEKDWDEWLERELEDDTRH